MEVLHTLDPGIVTHAIAAVAFLLVCVLLMSSWRRRGPGIALIVACGLTALWATAAAAAISGWQLPTWIPHVAELLRSGSWLSVLIILRGLLTDPSWSRQIWRNTPFVLSVGLLMTGFGDIVLGSKAIIIGGLDLQPGLLAGLGLAIAGLLLLESIFKLTIGDSRWAFKHLVIGLGMLFGFDLVLYSEALLFKQFDPVAIIARPLINTAIAPFVVVSAARIRRLSLDVSVSRNAALQTTALVGSGLYLVAISGIGYLMREADITWGPVLQVTFVCGAIVLLSTVLMSGQARARARRLLAENFFSFTFDYRHEWIRFIATISSSDQGSSLHERAVRAVADVFECSVGAIYVSRPDGALSVAGRWKWGETVGLAVLPVSLTNMFNHHRKVLVLSESNEIFAASLAEEDVRVWFGKLNNPWLLLPLHSRDELVGAIVLGHPRLRRTLTWEDRDLLGILSIQIASYVVEERATRALVVAQKFENVGKRFTFLAHDLKNLVSQLTLVLHHAEQHGRNPEFLHDAFSTVKASVEKMERMLIRLRDTEPSEMPNEPVEIGAAIAEVIGAAQPLRERIVVRAVPFQIWACADQLQLIGILRNIVQNSLETISSDGLIDIGYMREGNSAFIEIHDNGAGMTRELVEQHLFTAFTSTKSAGYGVGLYQAREMLERWGGRIEINSIPGRGTTILLRLLAVDRSGSAIEQQGGAKPSARVQGIH